MSEEWWKRNESKVTTLLVLLAVALALVGAAIVGTGR